MEDGKKVATSFSILHPPSSIFHPPSAIHRRGFSAVELLVVVGILVILISIFVPYILKIRETDHRVQCANNLRGLFSGLSQYAALNNGNYPRVVYNELNDPSGYTCYTGADGGNPFAKNSSVQPNDVTASLWLLVRLQFNKPQDFICPSTRDDADPLEDATGHSIPVDRRGNFRGPNNLSYSYASPFSAASGYQLNDTRRADFAVMADKNPGVGNGSDVTAASDIVDDATDQQRAAFARANSHNHGRAGQNVLYADSHVEFRATPYCGATDVNHPEWRDNIYTVLAAKPVEKGQNPPANGNGVAGTNVGPAWPFDSYLVPTATDPVAGPAPITSMRPATNPATAPAVSQPASSPATTRAIAK
jgi:prepilin-type N-terminal cleavage/methylation domain-containing protein